MSTIIISTHTRLLPDDSHRICSNRSRLSAHMNDSYLELGSVQHLPAQLVCTVATLQLKFRPRPGQELAVSQFLQIERRAYSKLRGKQMHKGAPKFSGNPCICTQKTNLFLGSLDRSMAWRCLMEVSCSHTLW